MTKFLAVFLWYLSVLMAIMVAPYWRDHPPTPLSVVWHIAHIAVLGLAGCYLWWGP